MALQQNVIDAVTACRSARNQALDYGPDSVGANPLERLNMLPTSRYRETLLYSDLGPAFGRFSHRSVDVPADVSDDYHQVLAGEQFRLDLISYQHYATARLWWVLALANGITNPFIAPYIGDLVRVPTITRIISSVLRV